MNTQQESINAKTQNTYNAASDHYDDTPLGFWVRAGQRTVDHLYLAPGSTVLDVGCGTGASTLPAAQKVASNGRVIGVDLAENLLALARAKAANLGFQNVEFNVGDMTSLGFPDAHFDAVVSVFSIFFVADMEKQVRELWRMVKPGGQLAITTWGPTCWAPLYNRWWAAVQRLRPDLYSSSALGIASRRRKRSSNLCSIVEYMMRRLSWNMAANRCAHPKIGGQSFLDRVLVGQ